MKVTIKNSLIFNLKALVTFIRNDWFSISAAFSVLIIGLRFYYKKGALILFLYIPNIQKRELLHTISCFAVNSFLWLTFSQIMFVKQINVGGSLIYRYIMYYITFASLSGCNFYKNYYFIAAKSYICNKLKLN